MNNINNISIDTYKNGCIYKNNAVISKENYTEEEWNILLSGGELESEWDEDGNPIAWDSMSEE